MMRIYSFLISIVISTYVFAYDKHALQKLLDEYTVAGYSPGVSLCVSMREHSFDIYSSGVSDIASGQEITEDSLFKVGSVIKTMTAVIVLKLMEDGKIRLLWSLGFLVDNKIIDENNTLAKLITQYPYIRKITIRELLNHSSGLYDEQSTISYKKHLLSHRNDAVSIEEHLRRSFEQPLTATPLSFNYSNVNYILLGLIIEAITKNTYEHVINDMLLKNHGLINSYYYFSSFVNDTQSDRLSHGYTLVDFATLSIFEPKIIYEKYKNNYFNYIDVTYEYHPSLDDGPAGALVSTTKDLATFANLLFLGKILHSDTMKYITDIDETKPFLLHPTVAPNIMMQYRFGVWSATIDELIIYRMIGEQWGYRGGVIYIPKQKHLDTPIIIAYAANTDNSFLEKELVPKIFNIVIDKPNGAKYGFK